MDSPVPCQRHVLLPPSIAVAGYSAVSANATAARNFMWEPPPRAICAYPQVRSPSSNWQRRQRRRPYV